MKYLLMSSIILFSAFAIADTYNDIDALVGRHEIGNCSNIVIKRIKNKPNSHEICKEAGENQIECLALYTSRNKFISERSVIRGKFKKSVRGENLSYVSNEVVTIYQGESLNPKARDLSKVKITVDADGIQQIQGIYRKDFFFPYHLFEADKGYTIFDCQRL